MNSVCIWAILAFVAKILRDGLVLSFGYMNSYIVLIAFFISLFCLISRVFVRDALSIPRSLYVIAVMLSLMILVPALDEGMLTILFVIFMLAFWYEMKEYNQALVITDYQYGIGTTFFLNKFFAILLIIYSVGSLYDYFSGFRSNISGIYGFVIDHYYLSYLEYGFVQRGLLGTIIQFLFGYYISIERMRVIVGCMYGFCTICVFAGMAYIFVKARSKTYLVFPVIFLCFNTIIPSIMTNQLGRLDIYLAFLGLIELYLIVKNNNGIIGVIVLSIIAILIHPVYVFIVFPIVLAAMLIRIFISPDGKKRRNVITLVVTLVVLLPLFYYFTSVAYKVIPVDMNNAKMVFEERTGEEALATDFWREANLFFRVDNAYTVEKHFSFFSKQMSGEQFCITLMKLACFVPLFVCNVKIYSIWAKNLEDKVNRGVCLLLPLFFLLDVPLYILETDHGRWSVYMLLMLAESLLLPCFLGGEKVYSTINGKQVTLLSICTVIGSCLCGSFGVYT